MPQEWQRLWEMLPGKQRVGAGWTPPVPLILAAWWEATPSDKRRRLGEHLAYAERSGVLSQVESFLRGLPEEKWFTE
jgi:hypothetical protein